MTQFLSLVIGNSSPLGLSGGATPSAKSEVAFADLLSAPRTQVPANLPFSAGLRTGSTPMPEVGEAVARTQMLPAPLGVGSNPEKEALSRDPGTPTLPMPSDLIPKTAAALTDTATALPQAVGTAMDGGRGLSAEAAILTVEGQEPGEGATLATQAYASTEGGPALAPVPATQSLLSGTAPIAVASATRTPQALTTPESGSSEAFAPAPGASGPRQQPDLRAGRQSSRELVDGTARSSAEQVFANADTQPDQLVQIGPSAQPSDNLVAATDFKGDRVPVSEPIEGLAGKTAQADLAMPADSSGVPIPSVSVPRAVAAPDEPQPSESSDGGEQPLQGARDNNRPAPDAASLRSATANAPEAGRTTEFAQVLQASAGESAAPSADSGPVTAELLSQMRSEPARNPAEPVRPMSPLPETVSARPGEIGRQMGVEIARHTLDGRDSLTIRLDPLEMGEIQIRLQFDDKGTMRAHVMAESSVALEMLRRDSADLVRALGDAGVRTDAQSFQFEARSHGRGEQQGQQGQQGRPDTPARQNGDYGEAENDDQTPRAKLRSSGSLDLIA